MFYRHGKKAFHGGTVQIDRHQALQPAGREKVGNEPGPDRLPPAGAPVLAGIPEVGDDGREVGCPGPPAGIRQEPQFQEMGLHRRAGRLE
jgi:hypothetical protein